MGPKASYILKKYAENAASMNAYVKFEKEDQAKSSRHENGKQKIG